MTPTRRRNAAPSHASESLPIWIAATQQLIVSPADRELTLLDTELIRWLTRCTDRDRDELARWLTDTAPSWTHQLAALDDLERWRAQLARITADLHAVRQARTAPAPIRDTWTRLMKDNPSLRPADALTAARGIHA